MMNRAEYHNWHSDLRRDERDRSKLVLSQYSLAKNGLLSAKIPCAYDRIITRYNPSTLLYGIELEIENTYAKTEKISEILRGIGEHYCCRDGSLGDSGIEIVFGPKPALDYASIRKTLQALRDIGCTSHEGMRCGIHVHVGYTPDFTIEVAQRLRKFLCKSHLFFKQLSRRERGQRSDPYYFCRFLDNGNDRYRALNVRTRTAEFRFFRGTLNPNSFIASIECIQSLVNYAINNDNLNLRGYKAYLKTAKYHYLSKYIDKTIVKTPRKILTDEEKALKKLLAEQRLQRELNQITRVVDRCLESFNFRSNYAPISNPLPSNYPAYTTELPLEFAGTWNRRILRKWKERNQNYRAKIRTNNGIFKLNAKIYVQRSCGWGRTNAYAYLSN